MTIEKIDRGAFRCDTPDGLRLGFPTGLNPRRFGSADTVAMKKAPGIRIDANGGTVDWPVERFIEHEGEMVALGPWVADTKPMDPAAGGVAGLTALLPGIRALGSVGYPLGGPYLRAFRLLPDGGVLVFPPRLAHWVRENGAEKDAAADWESWVHPDLAGEDSWSFALGMMAWRILCQDDPCGGESGEERRERLRLGALPSIASRDGGLEPEAAALIDASLAPGSGRRPSLDDWGGLLARWAADGISGAGAPEEAAARQEQAARRGERLERQLRARRWFRRSGWKFAAVAAAVIAGIAFLSAPVRKALEIPATAGMPPMEVAAAYYRAIDELDTELMDDCTARNAGEEAKGDRRLVEMVFVTHKVRQGYEGIGELPPADDWLRNGRPDLPEGIWPWGITGLELEEMGDHRIRARYELWAPGEGADSSGAAGQSRTDILILAEGRRSWEIVGIERSTAE